MWKQNNIGLKNELLKLGSVRKYRSLEKKVEGKKIVNRDKSVMA